MDAARPAEIGNPDIFKPIIVPGETLEGPTLMEFLEKERVDDPLQIAEFEEAMRRTDEAERPGPDFYGIFIQ